MRQKTMIKKSGMLLVAMVLALAMGCAAVFADEESPSEGTISVQITVGEHGTVNGHTGTYTESITGGSNLNLNCAADDGFVIGKVFVNDAELDAEDLGSLADKNTGSLTLESLTQNVTVAVQFSEAGGATGSQEEPAVTGDDGNVQDDNAGGADGEGSVTSGDENSDPGEETPADSEGDAEDPDGDQDSEDAWNLEASENDEAIGETDLFPDDDVTDDAQEDGAADTDAESGEETGADNAAAEDGSDGGADSTGSDQTTADQSNAETEETESTDVNQDAVSENTDGKGSTEKTSDDSYLSESPKTGDSFPAQIILIMLASLCAIAGLIVSHLLRRRGLE